MLYSIEAGDNPLMNIAASSLADAVAQYKVEGPPASGYIRLHCVETDRDFVVLLEDGPICEVCGCSEHNPCVTGPPRRPCHWVSRDPYICSGCKRVAA